MEIVFFLFRKIIKWKLLAFPYFRFKKYVKDKSYKYCSLFLKTKNNTFDQLQ